METDEVSRLCPGQKDFVLVRGVHHQESHLCNNLKELYTSFKGRTGNQVGFGSILSGSHAQEVKMHAVGAGVIPFLTSL